MHGPAVNSQGRMKSKRLSKRSSNSRLAMLRSRSGWWRIGPTEARDGEARLRQLKLKGWSFD